MEHSPPPDAVGLKPETPSPPDLSDCTRVVLHYLPSTLEHIFPSESDRRLLNRAEMEYLLSLKGIVLDDPERIAALARDVSTAKYARSVNENFREYRGIEVTCYANDEEVTSFVAMWDLLLQGRQLFHCPHGLYSIMGLPHHERDTMPEVGPFMMRAKCAQKLWSLWFNIRTYVGNGREYPSAIEWCDELNSLYPAKPFDAEQLARRYQCPSAAEGKCHYAMNPNCTADSPPDTVLLFETKAGWNQHGGPELFALDNHEPTGGCVLLNECVLETDLRQLKWPTILFVRTPEEIQQLRWK